MTEKTMVADTLAGINGELVRYDYTDRKSAVKTDFKADEKSV